MPAWPGQAKQPTVYTYCFAGHVYRLGVGKCDTFLVYDGKRDTAVRVSSGHVHIVSLLVTVSLFVLTMDGKFVTLSARVSAGHVHRVAAVHGVTRRLLGHRRHDRSRLYLLLHRQNTRRLAIRGKLQPATTYAGALRLTNADGANSQPPGSG